MLLKNFIDKLVIGTAQSMNDYGLFPITKLEKKNYLDIFNFAKNKNITRLDTAKSYKNEKLISKFKTFEITTKINFEYDCSLSQNIELLKQHLKLLEVDKVENLLIHNFSIKNFKELKKLNDFFSIIKKFDYSNNIGFSLYYDDEILSFIVENISIDLIQIPLSIFDQRFVNSEYLDLYKSLNIKVQARSIYLQGLLLNNKMHNFKNFDNWSTIFNSYYNWLEKNQISPIEACISYIHSQKKIDRFIIGFNNQNNLCNLLKVKLNESLNFPLFTNDDNLLNPAKWQKN